VGGAKPGVFTQAHYMLYVHMPLQHPKHVAPLSLLRAILYAAILYAAKLYAVVLYAVVLYAVFLYAANV
jgi:hypothetical protein